MNNFKNELISTKIRVPKRKKRVEEGFSKYFYPEKVVSRNLLGDFKVNTSRGKELIEEIMNRSLNDISIKSLVCISRVLSNILNIELKRNIYRRKDLLVKWFDDNQTQIELVKQNISVEMS